MMYYYLYEIKNLINGKVYVGVHQTKDIDDGYMGSGTLIKKAIKKFGIANFSKTIVEQFSTPEQMFAREAEVVNEQFLARSDVYNLRQGGTGGFDHLNDSSDVHIARCQRAAKKLSEQCKANKKGIFADGFVRPLSRPEIQQLGNSPEARQKAARTQRATFKQIGHQQGEKNTQFGTCWITHDGLGNLKIKKTELDKYIQLGYRLGRVMSQPVK